MEIGDFKAHSQQTNPFQIRRQPSRSKALTGFLENPFFIQPNFNPKYIKKRLNMIACGYSQWSGVRIKLTGAINTKDGI